MRNERRDSVDVRFTGAARGFDWDIEAMKQTGRIRGDWTITRHHSVAFDAVHYAIGSSISQAGATTPTTLAWSSDTDGKT
jgi:hypothetical protein